MRQSGGILKTISKKTSKDDFKSMAMGVLNPKGRIHFSFGEPIKTELYDFDHTEKPNILLQKLAELIDEKIHSQFKLWPNNYVAYDILYKTKTYKSLYTSEEKLAFERLLDEAISKVEFDPEEVKDRFLNLYANPVINAKSRVKSLV